MNGKINSTLIASVAPQTTPFEVNDTDLKGFGLRVQPSGAMSYFVRYRLKGKQTRFVIGRPATFTPAQARDAAKSILAGVNLGKDPGSLRAQSAPTKTLGDFIDKDYKTWAKSHRKSADATLARLRANFDEHWDRPLSEISTWLIEKWRLKRLNHPKKPAKPATVNRDLNALKAALSRAVEWGLLPTHPLAAVKASKVEHGGVVRYLAVDERQRLLATLAARESSVRTKRATANEWRRQRGYPEMPELPDGAFVDHLRPAIIISLNTGMRQGELFSLRWADVDLERSQLTICADSAKSGRTRHIPLNSEALTALQRWREQCDKKATLVFPGTDGKRRVDVKTSWSRLLRSADVQDFRWHDMRHDFASRLVMAGVDLNTVRELLGHADLKMTLRYAHLAPEHKAAAVAKLSPSP